MKPFSLNLQGRLFEVERPLVMGVLNVTPDSFYSHSRALDVEAIKARVSQMVSEGADIIDIGGCSTRPGATSVDADEELRRVRIGLETASSVAPEIILSVDTFRASVAEKAVSEWGAQMVNDVSGGSLDPDMFSTVARLRVPYVLTHTRGSSQTMQDHADYGDVTAEVVSELSCRLRELSLLGVADVIVDPGFGFAKTPRQSLELLGNLEALQWLGCPVMVGVSRKSMLTSTLSIPPEEALEATVAANAFALDRGGAILRVHDVKAARQAVDLYQKIANP